MSFHAVFKDEIQTNGFRTNLLNNYYQFHFWVVDLILMAGIPLLTVQQEEVDHLFLVITGGQEGTNKKNACGQDRCLI